MTELQFSSTEENYLKALYKLVNSKSQKAEAGTNELAALLGIKPATANDMLKKLREKKVISYEKYGKITLTAQGKKLALKIVRKHRLWETFLHEKLGFKWDEVHEVAEQLEHIASEKLIERLDKFLGFPEFDPHGDPIPNERGEIKLTFKQTLLDIETGHTCKIASVTDTSSGFLQYAARLRLSINKRVKIVRKESFDDTIEIDINGKQLSISSKFAQNVHVICPHCKLGQKCKDDKCQV